MAMEYVESPIKMYRFERLELIEDADLLRHKYGSVGHLRANIVETYKKYFRRMAAHDTADVAAMIKKTKPLILLIFKGNALVLGFKAYPNGPAYLVLTRKNGGTFELTKVIPTSKGGGQ